MVQPKEFRYTLEVRGIGSYVLENAPDGWLTDSEVKFGRSDKYYGMVRSLTVPLKFTLRGAGILRSQYYTRGLQAQVYILVEKLDTSDWQYKVAYYGKIDFSTSDDEDQYFTVNATEADISVKIKAFENVKYEIPFDDGIDVRLTPLKLVETASLLVTLSDVDQQPGFTALDLITNDVKATQSSVQGHGYGPTGSPDFSTSGDWFFRANTDTDVTINFTGIQGSVQSISTGSNRFRWQLVKDNGTVLATLFDITIENDVQGFDANNEYTISLSEGERLYMYQRLDGGTGANTGFNWTGGEISLTYDTSSPASRCKALRPKYVAEQLIKAMNGGFDYPVQSFLLDEWRQLVITSGDAIRGIEGAKLKLSWNDFFKSINAVLCAGHGIENDTVTIEKRQSYYRDTQVLNLSDAKDVHITSATDLMFNSIKVGYPDQTYDELNGRDEVNSQQNYVIDVTEPQKELDLMSEIRADAYGVEFLRINLDGKTSTDSDSDNDAFFLYIEAEATIPDLSYELVKLPASAITGVAAKDTYYNWMITPKRNLLRHGAWIRSVFYGNDGGQIRFASGLKNTDVTTSYEDVLVQENGNINIGELEAPYFMPFYAEMETDLPNEVWKYINAGVYGYAVFPYVGVDLSGFAVDVSVDLGANSERTFKLLLRAGSNVNGLIR